MLFISPPCGYSTGIATSQCCHICQLCLQLASVGSIGLRTSVPQNPTTWLLPRRCPRMSRVSVVQFLFTLRQNELLARACVRVNVINIICTLWHLSHISSCFLHFLRLVYSVVSCLCCVATCLVICIVLIVTHYSVITLALNSAVLRSEER